MPSLAPVMTVFIVDPQRQVNRIGFILGQGGAHKYKLLFTRGTAPTYMLEDPFAIGKPRQADRAHISTNI